MLSPTTLRNLVGLLRSVYAAAVLDRLVGTSPVVRLQLPKATRERVVPLTVEQVRSLAAAIPERNRAMVIAQAGLGLRIGELLALGAEDVDFLRRTVRVEWQIPALAEHMRTFPPAADGSLVSTTTGAVYRHDYYGAQIFARPSCVQGCRPEHDP